jgi:RHS repeat-associated protein
MKLSYEDANFYDGNIGKQEWISAVDNLTRTYTYSYDGASRILGASFSGGKPNENYSLENMSYDLNGNIKTLWRKGMSQTNTFNYIDKLSYTYANYSNKLLSVGDAITGNLNTSDFRDGNTSGNDYTYWADGSLKSDLNKGISLIEYNYMKLHKKITFSDGRVINFQYDASGKKLKETASNGDVMDYTSNVIYKNNVLYQIVHGEGRIVNGTYEYDIADHLGNLRLSFKDSSGIAKITQAQDYEPFGLENWTSKYVNSSKISEFKFNGIEKQKETNIYLAAFRGLDSQIGRWTQIDPKPNESMSLYSAINNNPVRYSDPLGDTIFVNKIGYITRNDKKDNFVFMQGDKGKLTSLGELGKKINVKDIYKNLLAQNMKEAKSIYSPFTFKSLVQAKGEWDLKVNNKTIYGLGNDGKTQFQFQGKKMESQDIGNHHFGAVANAYGFGQEFALKQAGVAQMGSGTSQKEWQIYGPQQVVGSTPAGPVYSRPMLPPYGDDPRDQSYIKEGYQYYNNNKENK